MAMRSTYFLLRLFSYLYLYTRVKPNQPARLNDNPPADPHPWRHPYLIHQNIADFRRYSEDVWQFAQQYSYTHQQPVRTAFCVNMAQNMYNWCRLSRKYGFQSELHLHPLDNNAISSPQWEDFYGEEIPNTDITTFLANHAHSPPHVPVQSISMHGSLISDLFFPPLSFRLLPKNLHKALRTFLASPFLRFSELVSYPGIYPYFNWALHLSKAEAIYAASSPLAAFLSGVPYLTFSVGADLQYDCSRPDLFGQLMRRSFLHSRFLCISNPHTLGHSRRLRLSNGIYLPYPIDTDRYSPRHGQFRSQWEQKYGAGTFILTTARVDPSVKGFTDEFFLAIYQFACRNPTARFIFLSWGSKSDHLRSLIASYDLQDQIILLPSCGKRRLIEYYRSCDIVLDQLEYGYYGCTALEAASIGKPVVMKIHRQQYSPLYNGDIAPVFEASSTASMIHHLQTLINNRNLRLQSGCQQRQWIMRNHAAERTIPILHSLIKLTADSVRLPRDLVNPLSKPLSRSEAEYHMSLSSSQPHG